MQAQMKPLWTITFSQAEMRIICMALAGAIKGQADEDAAKTVLAELNKQQVEALEDRVRFLQQYRGGNE